MLEVYEPVLEETELETGEILAIYGDAAFPFLKHLWTGFRGINLSSEQTEFNKVMSRGRIAIEWQFGHTSTLFAYVDFKKQQKSLLQRVGHAYLIGTILANCHICLYGGAHSKYFDIDPPSLEEYLIW